MQSANFRDDVVYPIAQKMGLDPTIDLQGDQAAAYVSYINAWVRRLYPNFDWPEWTLLETRTPDASHYVAFAQTSQKVIGRVLKVYLADPSTINAVLDTPFKLNEKGIHVGFEHGPSVWIKYIEAPPKFTAVVWVDTTTYALGSLIYSAVTGNCYKSLQGGNLGHAVTDPAWWALIPFPLELADLVARGGYADAVREDGQTDKANAEEQAVWAEVKMKQGAIIPGPYNPMTDQARPAPRYHVPGVTAAAATGG